MKNTIRLLAVFLTACLAVQTAVAQRKKKKTERTAYDQGLYEGMEWRLVGPFRGGRAGTVSGVPTDPNLYYMGTAGGGVWKTPMPATLGAVSRMAILVGPLVL